jgi:hypothetical protein
MVHAGRYPEVNIPLAIIIGIGSARVNAQEKGVNECWGKG